MEQGQQEDDQLTKPLHALSIMVPVTSRAVGFYTADAFRCCSNKKMYKTYRFFLALFQAKVYAVSLRHYNQFGRTYKPKSKEKREISRQQKIIERFPCFKERSEVPSSIAALINAVRKIETQNKVFIPCLAQNNYTPEGAFIPQSEHVYLFNLRETVVALADPQTDRKYRKAFYEHNPIPGAIWQDAPDNPILLNKDEIIPDKYDISRDLEYDYFQAQFNKCVSASDSSSDEMGPRAIELKCIDPLDSCTDSGDKSLLICHEQMKMKVPDRLKDEKLKWYLSVSLVMMVWRPDPNPQSLAVLTRDDRSNIQRIYEELPFSTLSFLLGERPLFPSLLQPDYLTRDPLLCCQFYNNLCLKAVPTIITTRGIGFGVARIFQSKIYGQLDPITMPEEGNIYQVYRTCLYLIQSKTLRARINCRNLPLYSDKYQFLLKQSNWTNAMFNYPRFVLDPIARIVDSVGLLEVDGTTFLPVIITDSRTDTGTFIPRSERVFLYNLRDTVVALADEKTPVEYRRSFYENNPIPGTIWENTPHNPVLMNPDDVIPQDYSEEDLLKDFIETSFAMNAIARDKPELQRDSPFDLESYANKRMLTCNEQNQMRVTDRQPDYSLEEYYETLKIEGDIREFYNYVELKEEQQPYANVCLLSERPVLEIDRYPYYITKSEEVCVQFCLNRSYKNCWDRVYNPEIVDFL